RAAEAAARAEAERRAAEAAARAEAERRAAEAAARAEAERRAAEAAARAEAERLQVIEHEAQRLAEREARRLAAEQAERERLRDLIAAEAERLAEEEQMQSAWIEETNASGGEANAPAGGGASAETERYKRLISDRVEQFWSRPPGAGEGLWAKVRLRLLPSGEVEPGSLRLVRGSGYPAFDQSVIAAIESASPLPVPSGADFEPFRDFDFTFRPDD
ncbi:MAG: cell envelope integrity protein TolA, partial [Chromatiaceae bacterium]|nr:cell envelope integrity protein TolA [Chromatiaceae bacterium]